MSCRLWRRDLSADAVTVIARVYRDVLARVDAASAIRDALRVNTSGEVLAAGHAFPIPSQGVYLIAIGKASVRMASAAAGILGETLAGGVAVTKDEDALLPARVRVMKGAHPAPDERSIAAGNAVVDFARLVPRGALALCLISGGGSALVESPIEDVTLEDIQSATRSLLRAGASIQEINSVRSRLSAIKAGGLLVALSGVTVCNLIVSDVLGDDLQSIASGPTVVPSHATDAESVLRRYSLDIALPQPRVSEDLQKPNTAVISNVSRAIDAAVDGVLRHGLQPFVQTRSITGEAREVGKLLAGVIRDAERGATSLTPGTALICGGEMVVTLTGDGVGGRNTEAALSAAIALSGASRGAIGFLTTDGDDGVSGAAGAIVNGETVPAGDVERAREALGRNDSFTYLRERGAIVTTGPTGTNVNDIIIGVIE